MWSYAGGSEGTISPDEFKEDNSQEYKEKEEPDAKSSTQTQGTRRSPTDGHQYMKKPSQNDGK